MKYLFVPKTSCAWSDYPSSSTALPVSAIFDLDLDLDLGFDLD